MPFKLRYLARTGISDSGGAHHFNPTLYPTTITYMELTSKVHSAEPLKTEDQTLLGRERKLVGNIHGSITFLEHTHSALFFL